MLSAIVSAFKKRNLKKLKKINGKLLRNLDLASPKEHIDLTILSYVLYKLLTKLRLYTNAKLMESLDEELERQSKEGKVNLDRIEKIIEEIEKEDQRYIKSLFEKARLKMAATLYAKGYSLSNVCEVFGVKKQEVMEYAGNTMMFDRIREEKTLSERLKYLEEIEVR